MVSCTEFIPLYSELFKYIEENADHDAVVRFWYSLADTYVADTLGKLVAEKGLEGCWEYWCKVSTEEACDIHREFDEENQVMTSTMRHCPSKGMLLKLDYMEPYHDYCGHCSVLYAPVLDKYGIERIETCDPDSASCSSILRMKKK